MCIVKVGKQSFKFCIVISVISSLRKFANSYKMPKISTTLFKLFFMNKQVQVKILTSKNIIVHFKQCHF